MRRVLLILAVFLFTGCNDVSQETTVAQVPIVTSSPTDSILDLYTLYPGYIKTDSSYKNVADTTYDFGYTPLEFDGRFWGDVSKHSCALHFTDTVGKTIYTFQKLQPGYTEWSEEGHIDFSGITILRDTNMYFLPADMSAANDSLLFGMEWEDTVSLRFTAWIITSVNGKPVVPSMLFKNVKKL